MDDSGSWSETSSPDASLHPPGKKAKGKAPLPPGDLRYSDSSPSFDSADTSHFNMDQKENLIDRDIELMVVLPGEKTTSTIVNGSKPMMDLLILLCGQYRLNPSTYTIDLISADNSQLKFKPNTPIGMLEVEKVVLKSKIPDDKNKKPGPIMPEQSVRVVINYKKTQKTIMRVSPFLPLQDLIPSICNKCEFDPLYTVLLKDYQSQQLLDVTKSLNELGLRELYALDQSRGTSPSEYRPPPLQESFQNLGTKPHDDKGFFNFFRRSKKKRDQTSSAPATPLLNKPRPMNVTRANTVTKAYDTNTLPSDVPKKRRAPLPPMMMSNEIIRGQMRTSSCVVKSVSVDENNKAVAGIDRARTGSLQCSGTTSLNSSLRRTKRKAPLPPSPPPKTTQELNDENSNEIVRVSEEITHVKTFAEEEDHKFAAPADKISEHNLEEIAEKEEASLSQVEESSDVNTEDVSKTEDISISSASTDIMTDPDTHESSVASDGTVSFRSYEDEIMTMESKSSSGKSEDLVIEYTNLEYETNGHIENGTSTQTSELENNAHVSESKAINTETECHTLPSNQHDENKNDSQVNAETETKENLVYTTAEKGKTQDCAVQTVNFDSVVEMNTVKESAQDSCLATLSITELPNEDNGQTTQRTPSYGQRDEFSFKQSEKTFQADSNKEIASPTENVQTQTVTVVESLLTSHSKSYQLMRQNTEPKLKPSNEITRDYLPKIGMTTYKIVPQRSFDIERYTEYESSQNSTLDQPEPLGHAVGYTKNTSTIGLNNEHKEPSSPVKNGNHAPLTTSTAASQYSSYIAHQHASNVSPTSPVSKSITETTTRKEHVPIIRSLSSAPGLNSSRFGMPELKPKDNTSGAVKAPNSFYLQMQRRASSMYVTSAIAKSSKSSPSVTNNTVTSKDIGKDTSQVTIKTLPSKIDMAQLPVKIDVKISDGKTKIAEKTTDSKNGVLESTCERNADAEIQPYFTHAVVEKYSIHAKPKGEVSLIKVSEEYPELESSQDEKQSEACLAPADDKLSHLVHVVSVKGVPPTTPEEKSPHFHHAQKLEEVSTTTTVRSLSSPTSPSAPLSLQKLRTFATPRPFTSTSTPFASAVSSAVKRSQSFGSSTSPVKQSVKLDSPTGWAPVTSPTETQHESTVFSGIQQVQSVDQILTPDIKYRVHSPPPIPEKKATVSFQNSDPEILRQSLLSAIRSGEAAANLKRITVRSNTISINGRSKIGHPAFSETQHEV
ncbi:cordon-bleu protein-like 1 [Discoglossus pictus]